MATVLLWSISQPVLGQTGSTEGREFYVGFLVNGSGNNDNNISIFVSSKTNTSGIAQIAGTNYRVPFDVVAGGRTELAIPSEFKPTGPEIRERIAVRITTVDEVTVHALNEDIASADATMVLPINSLGESYLVHTYNNDNFQVGATQNQLLLVGTADTTIYEVRPVVDMLDTDGTVSHPANVTFQDTLLLGEQIAYYATLNLSGTTVNVINNDPEVFCKPIAVFSGHISTLVDNCNSADHLYNQMYPTADWGKEYVVVPFETRSRGDIVQILAAEDNTSITTTTSPVPITLDRGDRTTLRVENPLYIESNRPISVMQLTTGKACDADIRGDNLADPFMIILSPSNQIIQDVVFQVMTSPRTQKYFISMVTPTQNLSVNYDGTDISSQFLPVPGNADLSYLTIETNQGPRRLISPNGVVAHVYGFGDSESFGYAVGGDLGEFDVEIRDEQLGVIQDEICEASELTLTVTSDIQILKDAYTSFRWEISDGTILFGDVVTHEFTEDGEYVIDMIASKGTSQCSNLVVRRTINVIADGVDGIVGPASVCPDAQDIQYFALGTLPDYTYEWFVDGGTIDGSSIGNFVTVDWDISNPNPRMRVLAKSPSGCLSDTISYNVLLSEALEPLAPTGPIDLCSDDFEGILYTTPFATGSTYTWEAIGGSIISGQGTNEVLVDWDGPGQHTLRFFETTIISNQCDGVSQDLTVIVYEPLTITETVMPVSCFGEADGSIEVSINGGLGPYTATWDVGVTGNSLTDRSAGTYCVNITDALGCTLTQEIVIGQPNELGATVTPIDAVCNGARGGAMVSVTGGTMPYSFNWSNGVTTSTCDINGLSKGDYSVQVVDANNCEVNLDFSIAEPAAIEVDFVEKQACPDVADGGLTLEVSGGTAPYTFLWAQNTSTTGNELNSLGAGDYNVTVMDAAGCSLSVTGTVTNLKPLVNFPTAFSPNNDQTNDTFGAVFNCVLDFEMVIYSKWGEVVFSTNEITGQWDGTFGGELVPQGVYTYRVRYTADFNGNEFVENVNGRIKVVY
ncbi:hypothetical protein BFP97_05915 [Roseivirga sp. 4D4]|nr:hypothetical protein BFP97_05915 [Roseivirga sp. 4D4]